MLAFFIYWESDASMRYCYSINTFIYWKSRAGINNNNNINNNNINNNNINNNNINNNILIIIIIILIIIIIIIIITVNGRKEGNVYLRTHSTHFIYGYMASDVW